MTKIANHRNLGQKILTYIGITILEYGIDDVPAYMWTEIQQNCWYDVTVNDLKEAARQVLSDYHNELHNRII